MTLIESDSILVVDDDPVFCARLARAFRERGLMVREATSSIVASEIVARDTPARVVLDLRIGSDSGMELLQKIHTLNKDILVVILTGYGTISTAVEALKLGAINYLTKPVDADTVLAAFSQTRPTEDSADHAPHLAQVEWDYIQRVISDCDGNISKASKILGLHRRSLQRKLAKNPARLH